MCNTITRIKRVERLFNLGHITNVQAAHYLKYALKTDKLTEYVFINTILNWKGDNNGTTLH